jgi:predicted DNA-binding transcriptional regulator AlpA
MTGQCDIIVDDDALIEQYLGRAYRGRRFLRYRELEEIGLCDNRAVIDFWVARGVFPRPIRLGGPSGKGLHWLAIEIAQMVAQRIAERDRSANEEDPEATRRSGSFQFQHSKNGRGETGPAANPSPGEEPESRHKAASCLPQCTALSKAIEAAS